ncbi:hypothetical protein M011DRAFT_72738 [Sporormia fimetaria CBS 119925]|uniref:WW domain-containing protein n=1 Tax=Sporormia fimetaria CBS 119925 TaxID=1340428 RepID=A0A6A6VCY0_9PLEO|nr:hypothetical protein M011DRAFT_72738 [Sporormia fimetaria CBS 119925]
MSTLAPPEPPPSYETAVGSGSGSSRPVTPRVSTEGPPRLTERNGIPADRRRSMEDENRPLPPGWIRQFDPTEGHQFFVDTRANPPRSIWVHPYDDEQFLSTLSPDERKRHSRRHRSATLRDVAHEDTDDEDDRHHGRGADLPSRPQAQAATGPKGIHGFGRRMKDKLTGSTHEQREHERRERAEEERQAYIAHLKARQALMRAMQTGEPQFLAKDRQGRDVYIIPPGGVAPRGAYGINPYMNGPFANPNARFVRPAGPYGRPMGYGYGGGLGAPIAAGFLGGALLGGLMF